ncbi:MAG: 30S ribosome-binding factor RbfA [Candidatus Omnitrophica bacterium]|nr:30S ribosome-binding factor RbfA [Candidatus Omnitrophota bacterium]
MSRYERVASQIKREISNILHDELKDPRIGFITVTRVELSFDLKFAKIYYSVFGDSQQKIDTAKGLERARGFIRRLIAQRMDLKFTPEISFKEDDSIDRGFHIDEEIKKMKSPQR